MDLMALVMALKAQKMNEAEFRAAVEAYLEENPEAVDQAAIEAMFGDQLDGIEEDVGGLKSAIDNLDDAVFESVQGALAIVLGGEGRFIGTDGDTHNNPGASSYTDYFDVIPGATVTLNGVYLHGSSRACCVYDADENNPYPVASNTYDTTITFIVPEGYFKCRTTIAYGGSISGTMSYQKDKIDEIENEISIIGDETLETTAQTVTGAINELNDGLELLDGIPDKVDELEKYAKLSTTDLIRKVTNNDDGRKLTADGYVATNALYNLRKYEVTAGSLIYIKVSKDPEDNGGVFQFQNDYIVPSSGTQYKIGDTYTSAFDGFIKVPTGATYLIISQLATNTTNQAKNAEYTIPYIENEISGLTEAPIVSGAISRTNDIIIPKNISWDGTYISDHIGAKATTQGICSDDKRYLFYAYIGNKQASFVAKWDTLLNRMANINRDPGRSYGHCNDIAFIPKDFEGLDNGNVDRLYIVGLGDASYSDDPTWPVYVVNANTLEYITKFSTDQLVTSIENYVGVRAVTSNRHRGKIVMMASKQDKTPILLIFNADGTFDEGCTYSDGTTGQGLHCDDNYIYVCSAATGHSGNIDYFDWDLNPITRGHFDSHEYEFEGLAQIGETVYGSWVQNDAVDVIISRGRVSRDYFFAPDTVFPQGAVVTNVQKFTSLS